jgi:hypothetical protein
MRERTHFQHGYPFIISILGIYRFERGGLYHNGHIECDRLGNSQTR